MTSIAIFSNVGHLGNIFCDNQKSTNAHALMPSLLPKLVSSNKISFSKTDESAPCIIRKATFIEEIDDNDTNFELAFCIRVFSARDNQTQGLVMSRNIAGQPGR